jgi:Ser/Thr protein kinase RdoA (MazF antagonist)
MSTSDAMISLSRLARSAVGHAVDGIHPARRGFPARVGKIGAEWLEQALQTTYPGARLADVRVLDHHSGTTSRARLALEYADPGEGPKPPESVFLKLTPAGLAQRLFLDVTGIGRNELRFYRDVRPDLPVRAPEIHGLQSAAGGRRFVILLEDLGASSARLATIQDRVTPDDARAVMRALADLHAGFWESPRFEADLDWVPSYERRLADLPWERFVTGQMIGIALRRFASEFSGEFRRIAATCRDQRDLLERLWSVGDRTLVHGDCHQGNLFYEAGEAGFLDWQICARAPGMRDVSYFLCNSFSIDLRREHERPLIALYLDALAGHGIDAPDLEQAWRHHRLFALYTWIAAAFTAAAGGGLQIQEIGMEALRRATAAAEDLESVDCAGGRPARLHPS